MHTCPGGLPLEMYGVVVVENIDFNGYEVDKIGGGGRAIAKYQNKPTQGRALNTILIEY